MEADFYKLSGSTLTVDDAVKQLDVSPDRIVKSLVFKDEDNNPLLAIVPGDKQVDEDKLSAACDKEVSMAKAREVEEFTGYKIGEVPPVDHNLSTFVDSKIVEFDTVIAGGGSTHTLVELSPRDIIETTEAEIVDLT
ncbi:hypothetical protein AKJ51_00625 [candidate division MSBL1 archaeon SCGC-AAA382A20]|uniref:YbaK/aminoacyl-tRNA synthetase-associated domain-containing protein n=1 Tax=candidate division MSBL1 archaeon SCGC-AAA382A20 TaxID=1698280 RepID=A0A133VMP6_9EURY|nr:hypothetical protein AKJ51_00625 [candidate division MSBL1 archaeon SCGC-AAA382A20]